MDGLPTNIDFSPLIGRKIYEARITRFWMMYLLEDEKPARPDVQIEVESKIVFTDPSGQQTQIDDFGAGGGFLCTLLGLSIENASRRDDGGLVLVMSSGIRLEVVNDTSMYESVVLRIGEDRIVG